jgi:hypothetical protein
VRSDTRYLRTTDGACIAYQVAASGPVDEAIDVHPHVANVAVAEPQGR